MTEHLARLAYSLLVLDHFRLRGLVRGEPRDLGDPGLLERLGGESLGGECPGGEGLGGPKLRLRGRESGLLGRGDDGGQLLADGQAGVGRRQDLGLDQGLLGLRLGLGSGQGHGLSLDLGHLGTVITVRVNYSYIFLRDSLFGHVAKRNALSVTWPTTLVGCCRPKGMARPGEFWGRMGLRSLQ